MTSANRVLVTGGAGFIAGHAIVALLDRGYSVRTTVRTPERAAVVRAQLASLGAHDDIDLEFAVADLLDDAGWAEAVAGCEFVLHVASPVVPGHVENENDLIVPAREGTLRVLRAAREGGVARVVLTSAFHAIGFGWGRTDHVFTDDDWSKLDGPGMDAYGRSKVLAKRAAWDFVRDEGGTLDLTVINPVAVLGPVAGPVSGGNGIVRRILTGGMPGYPDIWIPIVDVRDVAVAHVLAMEAPDAAGQRFLLTSGEGLTLAEIGGILREGLGDRAERVPTRRIPNLTIRLAGIRDPQMRATARDLGIVKRIDGSKARRVLGWTPRGARRSVLDAAESMLAAGA